MQGTFGHKHKRGGTGHGSRNHKHGGINRCARYFYLMFHVRWRPEPMPEDKPLPVNRYKKNRQNKRKQ